MRLTESLSSHLAHIALEAIRKSGAEVRNDRLALAEIKKTLARHLDQDPKIDEAVRRRISSLQRRPPAGSIRPTTRLKRAPAKRDASIRF